MPPSTDTSRPLRAPNRFGVSTLALCALAALAACNRNHHSQPGPDSAGQSTKAAKAPLTTTIQNKGARGDRARSQADAPESGATKFDAAATDLQSLLSELKAPSPKPGVESPASAAASSEPALSEPMEPVLALDSVHEDRPAPPREPSRSARSVPEPANQPPEPFVEAVPSDSAPAIDTPESVEATPASAVSSDHPLALPGAKTPGQTNDPAPSAKAAEARNAPSFHIGTVALCQRVESFGRFTPLPSNKFIAGKPALMILYTELANFAEHEETDAAGTLHAVELSQQLDLFFDADGSRQYGITEQTVRDAARTPRKDFFVVQRIELPRNLSVGKYNLKITVRDRYSSSEAEKIVPITIVADPSIARGLEPGSEAIAGRAPSPIAPQPIRRPKR